MSRGSVQNQEGGQSEVGYIKPIKEGMDYLHSLPGEPQVIFTQIYGWKPDTHSLPLESRVAQIEHALGEAVVPHVSLQRLLNQNECIQKLLKELPKNDLDADTQLALVLDNAASMQNFVRVMEACRELDEHGATGSGQLQEHEPLRERLQACLEQQHSLETQFMEAQARTTSLLQRYDLYVDQLSSIFVALDAKIQQIEKAKLGHARN